MILLRALQIMVLLGASQFFICVFVIARLRSPGRSRTAILASQHFLALAFGALVVAVPVLIQIYTGFRLNVRVNRIPARIWWSIASILFTSSTTWRLGLHITGKTE